MQNREYTVTLVAPTGREQQVVLRIARDGVRLLTTNDYKQINKFQFEVIKKWIPANLRSRNPGSDDCLDLQIETDKGARDLRMRCTDANTVKQVITDLRDTVAEIMQDMEEPPAPRPDRNTTTSGSANALRQPPPEAPDTGPNTSDSVVQVEPADVAQHSAQHSGPLPAKESVRAAAPAPVEPVVREPAARQPAQPTAITSTMSAPLPAAPAPPAPAPAPTPIPAAIAAAAPVAQPAPMPKPQEQTDASASAALAAAASVPGAIPIQVLGSLPGAAGTGMPGVTQVIITTPQAQASPAPAQSQLTQLTGGDTQDDFEVTSRMASYGPGYINAAFDPNVSGARHGSFTYFAGATGPAMTSSLPPTGMRARPRSTVSPDAQLAKADAHATALESQVDELLEQNMFLESLVKRLSAEVSRRQEAGDSAAMTETELLVDDGSPLPAWLKDRRYLNPLLAAYDDKIAALEAEAASRSDLVTKLQRQVEDVVSENERVRGELAKHMDARAMALAASEGAAGSDSAIVLLREENELLRQENDLLVAQQAEMDAELQRLHRQLEERAQVAIRSARENAAVMAHGQQNLSRMQEVEAQHAKMKAALRAAESRNIDLAQQLTEARSELDDERIAADTAKRALSELQGQVAGLRAEAANATRRARSAADSQASLQVEVVTLRERYEATATDAANARREADALRNALGSVEGKLSDYQRKDAEVYSRIREAMEVAEEARLARDTAASRQRELEREVESLQARLASTRQMVRDAVYAELQGTIHSLTAQLETAKEALKVSETSASEHKAVADRAQREASSLTAELAALKEDLGETLSSKTKVTLMSLSTMEKIQEMQRERDEAMQQLETCTRQLDRAQRDWALERQSSETELRAARKAVAELDAAATHARGEAAGYARQSEALGREVAQLREAKTRTERDLRQQVTAARVERDQEVKAMAARLESALAACARSVSEAEQLLAGKEALLARWKEEAQMIAGKLERALGEHRRELDARDSETAALRSALDQVQAAAAHAGAEVEHLRGLLPEMQGALADAEARGAQLHMQLLAAGTREEELNQEVRSLQSMLERARFEAKRAVGVGAPGGKDPLAAKFEALRRGGDAVVGITAIPRSAAM